MNNKGFTLIELLSVVILLSIIIFLVLPNITNMLKSKEKETDELVFTMIKTATKLYIEDNKDEYPKDSGNKYCIGINKLVEKDYLKDQIKYNGEYINNSMSMQVTYEDGYTYEIVSNNECINNVNICKLLEGEPKALGSKYECQVNPDKKYNFYVIGTNEDGSSNLIMEANIDEEGEPIKLGTNFDINTVHWTENNSTEGPITSMTYLYNATKTWTNIKPISFTYKDREYQNITIEGLGYESIIATDGIAVIKGEKGNVTATIGTDEYPLRARMPIYAATYGNNYSIATEKGEIASKTETNEYLYSNLSSGKIDGYWSISSFYGASELGLYISSSGRGYEYPLNENGPFIGIRPVITVQL